MYPLANHCVYWCMEVLIMQTTSLSVTNAVLKGSLSYDDTVVLSYIINYPHFQSLYEDQNLDYLNTYYLEKAYLLENMAHKILYPQAIDQYRFSKEHDYPIMPYEVRQDYTITYNQDDILSLYYDQYLYTGGAHGNTERYSNTWNLKTGNIMKLKQLFLCVPNYKQRMIKAINSSIKGQSIIGKSGYFEDYKQNVTKEFNENNFYLSPNGVIVFFQQYEIAPYSSGIPQFLLPFDIMKEC